MPSVTKTCTRCFVTKPLDEFTRRRTGSLDGHKSECKSCGNELQREYHRKKTRARIGTDNPPKSFVTATKKLCAGCRELKPLEAFAVRSNTRCGRQSHCLDCNAAYRKEHREEKRMSAAAYRERPENRLEAAERTREWRAAHPDEARAAVQAWRLVNPDRVADYSAGRRAKLREVAVEDVRRLVVLDNNNGLCGICGTAVDPDAFAVDHIIPLNRGGSHSYANTQPAHPICNSRKHDHLLTSCRIPMIQSSDNAA